MPPVAKAWYNNAFCSLFWATFSAHVTTLQSVQTSQRGYLHFKVCSSYTLFTSISLAQDKANPYFLILCNATSIVSNSMPTCVHPGSWCPSYSVSLELVFGMWYRTRQGLIMGFMYSLNQPITSYCIFGLGC